MSGKCFCPFCDGHPADYDPDDDHLPLFSIEDWRTWAAERYMLREDIAELRATVEEYSTTIGQLTDLLRRDDDERAELRLDLSSANVLIAILQNKLLSVKQDIAHVINEMDNNTSYTYSGWDARCRLLQFAKGTK